MKTFKQFLIESKQGDLTRLQPNTKLSVFHGTTMKSAWHFVTKGIDSTKKHYRHYQHGQAGLFVAPDEKTCHKFGNYIIKFKVQGKNLYSPEDVLGTGKIEDDSTREWLENRFPKSFRPDVSFAMLSKGSEPQAIFIGTVSPRAIEKVYHFKYGTTNKPMEFTRDEFMEYIRQDVEGNRKSGADIGYDVEDDIPLFEPQEKPTYKQFIKKLAAYMGDTEKRTEDSVLRAMQGDPSMIRLRELIGNFTEDSVMQHLLPQILRKLK